MVASQVPNPSTVLPSDGVTEVLLRAAADNPITTLIIVGIIICFAWWSVCQVFIKRKQFDVMKSPEAAKAMTEMVKIEKNHKRAMARLKKG